MLPPIVVMALEGLAEGQQPSAAQPRGRGSARVPRGTKACVLQGILHLSLESLFWQQVPKVMGHETMVGPGPAPPQLMTTEVGSLLVRAGHKRYFFDACNNSHGQFLRITEVGHRKTMCGPRSRLVAAPLDTILQAALCFVVLAFPKRCV